ncbi:Tc toxin subunit A [Bordetella sp. LUAb4]|uniref:Tc toxin subunit A n=1 Tax=Bordetella sp. LUAb4 TaxID=2843195 RepID=UPI001E327EE5|nr:Tc toxin subunit A [Bordetella sp. LUAb4]
MAKAKEKATYAIRAVERSCGLREGTLEDLGLGSVQSVLARDEEAFLREYAEGLGSEKIAVQVYRLALSAQERLLRLYKADRFGLADLATDSGKNYPYTDTPEGNRPNWVEQFPMLHPFAEPDDICNSNSPAAYLANLYWVATQVETIGGKNADERLLLRGRRPDLAQLQINETSVNQVVSKLSLVTEALQSYLSTTKAELLDGYTNGASTALDNDTLLTRIYYPGPALPYHKPYDQVMSALTARQVTLGDIFRATDPLPPLWIKSGSPRRSSVEALRFSSGLSPDRALLLTQAADFSTLDKRADWYQTNYGAELPEVVTEDPQEDLNNVATFADQTSQTPADVRRLLCLEGYGAKGSTVTLTKNIDSDVTGFVPDPAHYGATFICGGKSVFLTLAPETVTSGTGKTVSVGDKLVTSDGNAPDDMFFFRLNQVSRLCHWTGLAPDVLDLLLAAPMKAEFAGTWVMDGNTLRLLGFYRRWSAAYGVDAEDVAAFFAPLSPYAVDGGVSKFDRVFNAIPGQMPICIGSAASKFNYLDGSDGGIVGSLCAALKVTETEFQWMARMVNEGGGYAFSDDDHIDRRLSVLSALYRIARVASCLKLSVADLMIFEARMSDGYGGITLADAQPNMQWDSNKDLPGRFDDMEDLVDMAEMVDFVRAQGLTPAGLASLVSAVNALGAQVGFPVPAATPAHLAVLNNVATLLPNSLFDLSTIGTLGLPAEDDSSSPKAIDWLAIVKSSAVVKLTGTDTAGLIAIETANARQQAIQTQLASYTLNQDAQGGLKYQSLLDSFTAVQQRQYGVTDGVLGEALGLDMATVHNLLLAFVSNGSYVFLNTCQTVLKATPSPSVANIGALMPLLNRYTHNAMLVKHYALTPASLAGLANVAWFGLAKTQSSSSWWMHSMMCLYALNGYILWCQRVGNEDDVLQYLQNYNVTSPNVNNACTELARQLNLDTSTMQAYIDWVTQAAAGTHGVLQDTTQMGRVLALMGLAEQSGLALNQILALTALKPVQSVAVAKDTVDKEFIAWQAAAADVMGTLDYTPMNEGIEA